MSDNHEPANNDFIRTAVAEDIASNRFGRPVHTRFPPEPNGYLHIGHTFALYLDFGIAEQFGGLCNLRFDDTNPTKEEQEYIDGIKNDIRWLGYDWEDREYYASDYFDQLYDWAVQLIKDGKAYVDELSQDEMRDYRGTLTEPGKNSPYRDRPVEENLDMFERMKNGEFEEGAMVLRAKIDMASPIINMRDPTMYRILNAHHPRTGDKWHIYPMYDWAHGQSDSIEDITHSLCSLEYVNHRPLYDWFQEQLGITRSQQLEFGRVSVSHTITSKRKLRKLVEDGYVSGWDDPRMPTLAGMRRRGYTPEALKAFCGMLAVSRTNSTVELAMLEHAIRDDLNHRAPRAMAVLNPLKVVVENYPEGQVEEFPVNTYPQDKSNTETRVVPFSREIYIEQSDFMEDPPRKYYRMAPGKEVRLMGAYYVTCTEAIKDDEGNIIEVRCQYDPESRGGSTPDGRKVRGTIHWVSAEHAIDAELRLYDTLFAEAEPEDVAEGQTFIDNLNPESLVVLQHCKLEPNLADAKPGQPYQFMRQGYFVIDSEDSTSNQMVFNRTVSLRDSWAKMKRKR